MLEHEASLHRDVLERSQLYRESDNVVEVERFERRRRWQSFLDVVEGGIDFAAGRGSQARQRDADGARDRRPLKVTRVHHQQLLRKTAIIRVRQSEREIVEIR